VPCGISDHGVTSLAHVTGRDVPLAGVEERLIHHFASVFERQAVITVPADAAPCPSV
jgi:lipoate-protein ligase B